MSLSNEQYSQIVSVIDGRRVQAERRRDAALAEVIAAIPIYGEMEEAAVKNHAERARALMRGDEMLADRLVSQIEDLREQQRVLLRGKGFPDDYLEVHYFCPDCCDTGFVDGRKCRCFRALEAELLYDASNIRSLLERENFDTFDFGWFDRTRRDAATGRTPYEHMTGIFRKAHEMADSFEPGRMNLLFTGDAGTGKTFLSNCIAREVIRQGFSVVYLSAPALFDTLADGAFGRGTDDRGQIFGCDLLIIDDLGTEVNSSFVSSQLFRCVSERQLRRVSTIISTNLDMNRLRDSYSERVSSRLLENYEVCRFFNPDIRILKRRMAGTR